MPRTILAFLLCSFAGLSLFQAQKAKEPAPSPAYVIPEEAVKRQNPVKADEKSIAEGKRLYATECLICHAEDGGGKSSLAESMQLTLKDLREHATTQNYTDGALFYIVQKGKGKMPPEEGRLKDAQVWSLVNYVRSIVKKEAEKPAKHP